MPLILSLFFKLAPVLVSSADDAKEREADKKELDRLQGTWTATTSTFNGVDFFANGKAAGFRFVFKGDEAVVEGNDAVQKEYARLRLKLYLTTSPRLVDLSVTGGVQKDAAREGIEARV
jgi:uncharacterized protein (TIGR03067 family)